MREELLQSYKDCLCFFCRQSAFLEGLAEDPDEYSEEEIRAQLDLTERAKAKLLRLKKELGFDGGLDFMEDSKFLGFEMKDGRLSGDYANLIPIVENFIEEFDEEKVYVYEVGTLVLFHYMRQMGLDSIVPVHGKKKRRGLFGIFKKLRQKLRFGRK